MRCSSAVGCGGLLGGLTVPGCVRWLTGLGLTATFAVGLALVRSASRGGAFFAASFLVVLVFLTVFPRLAVLVMVVFLRFALALVFVAMAASLTLTAFGKSSSDHCLGLLRAPRAAMRPAAPPSKMTNSRRRMGLPQGQGSRIKSSKPGLCIAAEAGHYGPVRGTIGRVGDLIFQEGTPCLTSSDGCYVRPAANR